MFWIGFQPHSLNFTECQGLDVIKSLRNVNLSFVDARKRTPAFRYRFGKLLPGNHKVFQGSVNKLRKGVGKKRHLNFHTW